MHLDSTTALVIAVVFAATLVRSTFGFGEALFAVPLLALRLPLRLAAPLAMLVSIVVAALVLLQDWRSVQVRSSGWLLGATLFGLPLGLLLLTSPHQAGVRIALGAFLIAFSLYSLTVKEPPALPRESVPWLVGCGFAAGVLGGAYGMNGPPLVIYGGLRRWSAQHLRATLQGYFLPASLLGLAGYAWEGLWTRAVTGYFLISLPAIVPAVLLGRWMNRRLAGEKFINVVFACLIVLGGALAAQAMFK